MYENTQKTCGIIVGLDAKQEYLLAYFYINLRLCSDLPITFFDFGMSLFGKDFCEKRGHVIRVESSLYSRQTKSDEDLQKTAWFKKPLACKKAPYDVNLWLDLDCKVIKCLKLLIEQITQDNHLYLAVDERATSRAKTLGIDYPIYNSGVIGFTKHAEVIDLWIKACMNQSFKGDQDALSYVIACNRCNLTQIDPCFNTISMPQDRAFDKIAVLHYITYLKEFLAKELSILEHLSLRRTVMGKV